MGESSLRVILKGGVLPHANTFVFLQLIIKPDCQQQRLRVPAAVLVRAAHPR